jgi:hypothetical protein
MIRTILVGTLVLITVLTLHLTILPTLQLHHYTNFFLILAAMAVLTIGLPRTIWWVIAGATIIDFNSLLPFGITLVSYVGAIALMYIIAQHWLTTRSSPTLILLIIIATILYFLFLTALSSLLYWLNFSDIATFLGTNTVINIVITFLVHGLLAWLLFTTTNTSKLVSQNIEHQQ